MSKNDDDVIFVGESKTNETSADDKVQKLEKKDKITSAYNQLEYVDLRFENYTESDSEFPKKRGRKPKKSESDIDSCISDSESELQERLGLNRERSNDERDSPIEISDINEDSAINDDDEEEEDESQPSDLSSFTESSEDVCSVCELNSEEKSKKKNKSLNDALSENGREKSSEELLTCVSCPKFFHLNCVESSERPSDTNFKNWACMGCRIKADHKNQLEKLKPSYLASRNSAKANKDVIDDCIILSFPSPKSKVLEAAKEKTLEFNKKRKK